MKHLTVYTILILCFLTLLIIVGVLLAAQLGQQDNEFIEYCRIVNQHSIDHDACYMTLGHSSL